MYILRTESHSPDADFFSHLNEKGLTNASKTLYKSLKNLGIDTIYVSPFVRSIETIYPYAKKKGIKIMVDYSLYDWIDSEGYGPGVIIYTLKDIRNVQYWDRKLNQIVSTDSFRDLVDEKYKSIYRTSMLQSFELSTSLEERVKEFLIKFSDNIHSNILIVTHLPVANAMLHLTTSVIIPSPFSPYEDLLEGSITNVNTLNLKPRIRILDPPYK